MAGSLRDSGWYPSLLIYSLALALLAADYFTGPYILFPITFVIPIVLAAWYRGRLDAVALAVTLSVSRYLMVLMWRPSEFIGTVGITNALIRGFVLVFIALLVENVARQHRQLQTRVRQLEGLLSICSFCKKIRDDNGRWHEIEGYISEFTDVRFSHGFCEPCCQKYYPQYYDRIYR